MKIKRIYVASPYTSLLNKGEQYIRHIAIKALEKANIKYSDKDTEFFSPVLTNMYQLKNLSHNEAMQICFKQLSSCDELFIPGYYTKDIMLSVINSKGIKMEYEYATTNGIPVTFGNSFCEKYFRKDIL